jgi:hypothetical protein
MTEKSPDEVFLFHVLIVVNVRTFSFVFRSSVLVWFRCLFSFTFSLVLVLLVFILVSVLC